MTQRPTLSQAQRSENVLVVLIPLGEKGQGELAPWAKRGWPGPGGPLAVEEFKSKTGLQTATLTLALLFFYAIYA